MLRENIAKATRKGSRVSVAANSGPQTYTIPSPRFETAPAVQSSLKSGPSAEMPSPPQRNMREAVSRRKVNMSPRGREGL
jgi:hypothetical protein